MLTTPATYRIVVQGQLGEGWASYFGGLTPSWQEPDQTVLIGQIVDQAALHGLLNTIRDWACPWSKCCASPLRHLRESRAIHRSSCHVPVRASRHGPAAGLPHRDLSEGSANSGRKKGVPL